MIKGLDEMYLLLERDARLNTTRPSFPFDQFSETKTKKSVDSTRGKIDVLRNVK